MAYRTLFLLCFVFYFACASYYYARLNDKLSVRKGRCQLSSLLLLKASTIPACEPPVLDWGKDKRTIWKLVKNNKPFVMRNAPEIHEAVTYFSDDDSIQRHNLLYQWPATHMFDDPMDIMDVQYISEYKFPSWELEFDLKNSTDVDYNNFTHLRNMVGIQDKVLMKDFNKFQFRTINNTFNRPFWRLTQKGDFFRPHIDWFSFFIVNLKGSRIWYYSTFHDYENCDRLKVAPRLVLKHNRMFFEQTAFGIRLDVTKPDTFNGIKGHSVILNAGDVLYAPQNTLHYAVTLEDKTIQRQVKTWPSYNGHDMRQCEQKGNEFVVRNYKHRLEN